MTTKDKIRKGDRVTLSIQIANPGSSPLTKLVIEPFALDQNPWLDHLTQPIAPAKPGAAIPTKQAVSRIIPAAIQIPSLSPGEEIRMNFELVAKQDMGEGSYPLEIRMAAPSLSPVVVKTSFKVVKDVVDAQDMSGSASKDDALPSGLPKDVAGAGSAGAAGPGLDPALAAAMAGYPGGAGSSGFGPATAYPDDLSSAGFFSTSGSGGSDTGRAGHNKPKLIISHYTITPEMPEAGKDFELDLTFTNTNAKKDISNIIITLNAQDQPVGSGIQGGMAQQNGSVFTPVDASNTFYIDKIEAKKETSKVVRLHVVPTAIAQNYTMNIQFEYEDKDGNEYRSTEVIGIPVVQQPQLLIGEVQVGEDHAGGPIPIDVDFYNTGKDVLTTFMVTLEGKGFTCDQPRYFVGNFAPGQSDHFSAEIHPEKDGEISGDLVFSYEDSAGNQHTEKTPFKTTVKSVFSGEGAGGISAATGEKAAPQAAATQAFSLLWILLIILVVAGLTVLIVLLARRSKKKKKDLTLK